MILAALILIALLATALAASMAFIAHGVAIEQRHRDHEQQPRLPLAA